MKRTPQCLSIFVVLGFWFSAGMIQADSSEWKLTASCETPNVLLGEPVHIQCVLTNTGKENAYESLSPISFCASISEDGRNFHPNETLDKQYWTSGSYRSIKPGGAVKESLVVLYNRRGKPEDVTSWLAFPKPGRYFVKIDYLGRAQSAPVEVTVREPKGGEARVWTRYADRRMFIYAQEFMSQKLYQAGFECVLSGTDPLDEKEAKDIEVVVARLKQEYPDSTYTKLFIPPEPANREPDPVEIEHKAEQELEAEYYDMKGFTKGNYPEALKAYNKARGELADRCIEAKMHSLEDARLQAQLLKDFIHKHLKPLPPEEWKRRYAAYAEEDKKNAGRKPNEED